jgi:hypothetical protein
MEEVFGIIVNKLRKLKILEPQIALRLTMCKIPKLGSGGKKKNYFFAESARTLAGMWYFYSKRGMNRRVVVVFLMSYWEESGLPYHQPPQGTD